MVRPRTCSETACTLICRRHHHEPNEDLTSRIHTIILHNLERIKDKDENQNRARKGEGLGLPSRSEPMEMGI